MRDRIEEAERQAAEARNRALECTDPGAKGEWLAVARMWELLAKEYGEWNSAQAELLAPQRSP